MPWQCFMVEQTRTRIVTVRRYSSGTDCPVGGYHNASEEIQRFDLGTDAEDSLRAALGIQSVDLTHDHGWSRGTGPLKGDGAGLGGWRMLTWPEACQCGYALREEDEWQVNIETLWVRSDSREPLGTKSWKFPIGAMFWADWIPENWLTYKDARGALTVNTPGGLWTIDMKASSETGLEEHGWTRSGEPPNVTASPSINIVGSYHGWLQAGVLSDPL